MDTLLRLVESLGVALVTVGLGVGLGQAAWMLLRRKARPDDMDDETGIW